MILTPDEALNNPLAIQREILTDYEERLDASGNPSQVVDANNPFMFILEAFSRTVGRCTVAMDTKLNSLYPRRATTTKELYNHLSDFDYVGFFSSPASLKLSMMLHKDYLVENAIQVPDTNYKLVVIPKDTIFTIGRFKMSLYYPINIRINSIVGNITAVYDTTDVNPLYSLSNNGINTSETSYGGIDLVQFEIDVFQFDKDVISESVNPDIGFLKKYKYDDKFYSVRVFDVTGSTDKELSYTMSDSVYDSSESTVSLKVYPETNEIQLSIPQIYFTNNLIGNSLRVEIYTTQGKIDVSISNIKLEDISANFSLDSPNIDTTYTNILKNIPTSIISPVDTRIVGGSDSFTFSQMKDSVIYHSNAEVVPVTPLQLDKYFESKGFKAGKALDNLTDRRYNSLKKLTLSENDKDLSVVNGKLTVNAEETTGGNRTIKYLPNNTIVVLPTAVYKYNKAVATFTPMTDAERDALISASPEDTANQLNSSIHVSNPYHYVIHTNDRYPMCDIYDLFSATTDDIKFEEENIYLSAQLNVVSATIRHLQDGSGGYIIRIGIKKSVEFDDIPEDDITIYLSLDTVTFSRVGTKGVFFGDFDGISVYDFNISTDYHLEDDDIKVNNLKNSNGDALDQPITLSGTMYISTFVKKFRFPNINQDFNILGRFVEDDGTNLAVSLQSIKYKLGTRLDDVLDSNLLTTWTGEQYQEYPDDVYLEHEHDVYETDSNGALVNTAAPGQTPILNKLHSAGDRVKDSEGADIIKHHKGDTVLDVGDNPIPIKNRAIDYTVDLTGYDYRSHEVYDDFHQKVAKDNDAYYDSIREMGQNVLENTDNFFKPITTLGDGEFKINNLASIVSDLNLSFEFNCYVTQAIYEDKKLTKMIKKRVTEIVKSTLDNKVISLVDISGKIRTELSDYITSIDVVSINGDTGIQTLVCVENDKTPKLNEIMIVNDEGKYDFEYDVNVNLKALDV